MKPTTKIRFNESQISLVMRAHPNFIFDHLTEFSFEFDQTGRSLIASVRLRKARISITITPAAGSRACTGRHAAYSLLDKSARRYCNFQAARGWPMPKKGDQVGTIFLSASRHPTLSVIATSERGKQSRPVRGFPKYRVLRFVFDLHATKCHRMGPGDRTRRCWVRIRQRSGRQVRRGSARGYRRLVSQAHTTRLSASECSSRTGS
jgi:hypothetical protein